MRRVRYGVSMSLDGYIAGPNGEYDWIPMDPDIDFAAMMSEFDTYLMGRRTFELTLSQPGPKMRGTVIVFSRSLKPRDHPGVTIVSDNAAEFVTALRKKSGKDISLFGGGELFRSLLELGVVDTVEVAVLPVLLGGGIPLLPPIAERTKLKLTQHRLYPKTGTLLLQYDVRRARRKR